MMTLSTIMTRDPFTVGPETTLREVIDVLSVRRISGAPVVAGGGRVVGVISASDVLGFVASMAGVPHDEDGADRDDAGGEDAAAGLLAGYWDDTDADVVTRMDAEWRADWDRLDEHTASEAMTRKLHTLPPSAGIADAARHMVKAGIHRLLVVEGDQLVGVVSTMDLVKAIATNPAVV
ncbi:MAG: CBS domain-containing protein [Gemmatimonadetes bacterium]|nr:CBS domain-containing protein [Gemmatimonadota bacterium]